MSDHGTVCDVILTCQAGIVLDYCEAAFTESPILKQLIANRTADTLELTNRITVEVRAASFRRLRGPTYCAVLLDEGARRGSPFAAFDHRALDRT
jgi:hypothetical protein